MHVWHCYKPMHMYVPGIRKKALTIGLLQKTIYGFYGRQEWSDLCSNQSRKESWSIVGMCYGNKRNLWRRIGTMPGRRRGRPRISWRDNIVDWTGMSMKEALSSVQDRVRRKRAVHNAIKLRSEDGWRQDKTNNEQICIGRWPKIRPGGSVSVTKSALEVSVTQDALYLISYLYRSSIRKFAHPHFTNAPIRFTEL